MSDSPRPTKVLLLSTHDVPTRRVTNPADTLTGLPLPAVIDFEGEPHELRLSPYVPAGHAYIIDTATLDYHALLLGEVPSGRQ